jgi:hypothetical protein
MPFDFLKVFAGTMAAMVHLPKHVKSEVNEVCFLPIAYLNILFFWVTRIFL